MVAEGMVNGGIPIEVVKRMVESNQNDVRHLTFNTYIGDVKKVQEMLVKSFDEQNPQAYSIPVSSQEEIKKVKAYGGNPVVVPNTVAGLLKDETTKRFEQLTKASFSTEMTLKGRFLRWFNAYSGILPKVAREELESLIEDL